MMKKAILFVALAIVCVGQMKAQGQSPEERQRAAAEMVKTQAERLAKDFDLKDNAKTAFIEKYTQYQTELFATMNQQRPNAQQGQQGERRRTSDMTDEEVTKQIQEAFARQATQIEQQQKRLEIQKKYYEEFSKTLAPKQLIRIFGQQRPQGQNGQNGQGQRGQGGQRGFGGGGGFGGPGGGFGGPGGGF